MMNKQQSIFEKEEYNPKTKFMITEFCSGIGGFRLGLDPLGGKVVLSSEIDKFAIETYEENFGKGSIQNKDITKLDIDKMPNFDILCAGFPCQPFSGQTRLNLNTPKNFAHKSGRIVYKIALLLKKIQRHNSSLKSSAPAFFFENVRFDSCSQYISHTLLTLKQRYSWR